jgi:hypothetical protein
MKGALGLTLAAGLGLIGAFANWFYLQRLAQNEEKVWFIAVKDGTTLNVGDTIKKEHLVRVGIPRSGVDYLTSVAPQWAAVASVENIKASRPFRGGEIILDQDVRQVAQMELAKTLQDDEVVRWVPVDAGSVVPEHINPGDWVSFDVPRIGGSLPTPAGSRSLGGSSSGTSEIIGPFRVVSLGGRREPIDIYANQRRSSGSESRIAIVVQLQNDKLEPQAERLFEAIRLAGNQGVQVQLHSAKYQADK